MNLFSFCFNKVLRTKKQLRLWHRLICLDSTRDRNRRSRFALPMELRAAQQVLAVLRLGIYKFAMRKKRGKNQLHNLPFGLYSYILMMPSSSPVTIDISPSTKRKSAVVTHTCRTSLARTTSLYGSSCSSGYKYTHKINI